MADWTRLYDFVGGGVDELAPEGGQLNMARPIDINLTNPLSKLPLGSFDARGTTVTDIQRNLAFRNLVRGRMVGLATGQEAVAAFQAAGVNVTALTGKQIVGSDVDLSDDLKTELKTATPLWFYILREAQLNGGRLSGVGGRIVAETFHRAIEGSTVSILRDPTFQPHLGPRPGTFEMTDLLQMAYDATLGELRPLSPDAPKPAAVTPDLARHNVPVGVG